MSLSNSAGANHNISTIYVVDEEEKYYGAMDLKDLIVAREYVKLDSIISRSYPYVMGHEKSAIVSTESSNTQKILCRY